MPPGMPGPPPGPPMPGMGGPTAPFAPPQPGPDPKELAREAVIAQLRNKQPEPAGSATPQPFVPPAMTGGMRRPRI